MSLYPCTSVFGAPRSSFIDKQKFWNRTSDLRIPRPKLPLSQHTSRCPWPSDLTRSGRQSYRTSARYATTTSPSTAAHNPSDSRSSLRHRRHPQRPKPRLHTNRLLRRSPRSPQPSNLQHQRHHQQRTRNLSRLPPRPRHTLSPRSAPTLQILPNPHQPRPSADAPRCRSSAPALLNGVPGIASGRPGCRSLGTSADAKRTSTSGCGTLGAGCGSQT